AHIKGAGYAHQISAADPYDMLEKISDMVGDCKCIKCLVIIAHGGRTGEGGFRIGSGANRRATGGDDGTALGKKLKGALCEGARICLYSRGGATGEFWKNLAIAAGCKTEGTTRTTWIQSGGTSNVEPNGSNYDTYDKDGSMTTR